MCCFVGVIRDVSRTRIFARKVAPRRQLLVYAMNLAADDDVAMILPLPVAREPSAPPAEDALRFVDMSACPDFFIQLGSLFPAPAMVSFGAARAVVPQSALVVHDVGDFEASFVPSQADFTRLDPRFRFAPEVWRALSAYADWSFAVFQLRHPKRRGVGAWVRSLVAGAPAAPPREFHPMAMEFPSRDDRLFFPTVHVHDGVVHPTARFDHVLFAQGVTGQAATELRPTFEASPTTADALRGARAWLDPTAPVVRAKVVGTFANQDVILEG